MRRCVGIRDHCTSPHISREDQSAQETTSPPPQCLVASTLELEPLVGSSCCSCSSTMNTVDTLRTECLLFNRRLAFVEELFKDRVEIRTVTLMPGNFEFFVDWAIFEGGFQYIGFSKTYHNIPRSQRLGFIDFPRYQKIPKNDLLNCLRFHHSFKFI